MPTEIHYSETLLNLNLLGQDKMSSLQYFGLKGQGY